jgi:hypothetical protein
VAILAFLEFRTYGIAQGLVLKKIHHSQGQRLGGIHQTFVAYGHSATGYHRPAVPGGIGGRSSGQQCNFRYEPAHIADISRSAFRIGAGIFQGV